MAAPQPPDPAWIGSTAQSRPGAEMATPATRYYDARYFAWQSSVGEFGGWANLPKFAPYIRSRDCVLDFGCGGGFLLKNLDCHRRIGIEVNPAAIATARENGVEVYTQVQDVPDGCVDVVISNHALEHVLHPLQELKALYSKLRVGGRLVLFVPCESISSRYRPGDINRHLYSWSPMCLGNLLSEAGFAVLEAQPFIHKWPPGYRRIAKLGGRPLFEIACRIFGRLNRSWFQLRAVAEKSPTTAYPDKGSGPEAGDRTHAPAS